MYLFLVSFILICKDTVNDFLDKNGPFLAAAISFYTLFSLFPLVLAVISVSGYILGSGSVEERIVEDIGNVVPVSAEFVQDTVQGVARAKHITGVASILGLLWASTTVFGAIRKGVNAAWGIRKTRPFLRERLMDFSLMLGASVLLLISISATAILSEFQAIMSQIAPNVYINGDLFWDRVALLLPISLSFLTFLVIYRFLPNTRVEVKDVWLGALLATIAFEVTKQGFVWYVTKYSLYNVVYGPIGAILALLTWVYISAIILLFGALVTSRYAAYLASREGEKGGIQVLWSGLQRVRLRWLESR